MALSVAFGRQTSWPRSDLITFSETWDPALALEGYRAGVFPMPLPTVGFGEHMGWWSPQRRGILPLEGLRITRSLRQSMRRYQVTINTDFGAVIRACANPARPFGWIDAEIVEAFTHLHRRGWAHSVETRLPDGRLVGGLYGVSIGGLFAGESMFHDPLLGRDASKVALVALVDFLSADGVARLLDVQWVTDHLASLGAVEVSRTGYLRRLDEALQLPRPKWPVPRRTDARDA